MSEQKSPSQNDSNESKAQSAKTMMDEYLKPTYLLIGSCIPLMLGAYAGYRSEIRRAASSAASDGYSPGLTSSGGGLLTRVIGDELMDVKSINSTSGSKMKSAANKVVEQAAHVHNVDVGKLAVKALGVGSLLSVGGFGLLAFAVFKATGSESLEDLIQKCRKWTPNKRKEFEQKFGIKPKSMEHEDVKATKGMTEDEEWEFIKKKYIPELVDQKKK